MKIGFNNLLFCAKDVNIKKTIHKFFLPGRSLFLLLFLFVATEIKSQSVKVNATIDTSSILIGDQINLQLSATYNPQLNRVQFPAILDTFNHFEVVLRSRVDTVLGREENTFKQTISITNFDSGQWKIPAFAFEVQSLKGGEPTTLFADSFLVNVNTVQVDTAQPIKPIFGIRSAKMPLKDILLYIIAAILIAALLGFLIWYFIKIWREKNKKPEYKEPEIILLPHDKALQALVALNQKELWQSAQEKLYHTELTDIVRTYLEEQFNIDCFEKTSTEIIHQVKKVKPLSNCRQSLRTIFETADMVKFAKSKPTADEHLQSMELANEIIRESYKKVKPVNSTLEQKASN